MAVEVHVGKSRPPSELEQEAARPPRPQSTMELNARKSLDGNFMIFDHPEIDIIVMPETKKVVAFAKNMLTDEVYETQDHLFKFLTKRGVITFDSIRGGNVYGSLEGLLAESDNEGVDSVQMAIFSIGKFVEEEKPYYEYEIAMNKQEEDYLLEPDAEHSTELGEVPHEETKGSIRPGWVRGPYALYDLYRA
jgi:hypothetical protein